jgi:hypothetical protein
MDIPISTAQSFIREAMQPLINEVCHTVYWVANHQPGALISTCAHAEEQLAIKIRQQVYQGAWAEAGVTDVQWLYDLSVRVWMQDTDCRVSVQMPYVFEFLSQQDDPNVN